RGRPQSRFLTRAYRATTQGRPYLQIAVTPQPYRVARLVCNRKNQVGSSIARLAWLLGLGPLWVIHFAGTCRPLAGGAFRTWSRRWHVRTSRRPFGRYSRPEWRR